jgi:hypothetical protein
VLGRCELFTEHTTLAAIPVLAGEASVGRLLRLWGLVYVTNVVGAAFFAVLASYVLTRLGSASEHAFGELGRRLARRPALHGPRHGRPRHAGERLTPRRLWSALPPAGSDSLLTRHLLATKMTIIMNWRPRSGTIAAVPVRREAPL